MHSPAMPDVPSSLDVTESGGLDDTRAASNAPERPWLGVRFLCSGAYVRVFRDPNRPCYLARCPRCGVTARFQVASGGTDHRFFEVDCARA